MDIRSKIKGFLDSVDIQNPYFPNAVIYGYTVGSTTVNIDPRGNVEVGRDSVEWQVYIQNLTTIREETANTASPQFEQTFFGRMVSPKFLPELMGHEEFDIKADGRHWGKARINPDPSEGFGTYEYLGQKIIVSIRWEKGDVTLRDGQ